MSLRWIMHSQRLKFQRKKNKKIFLIVPLQCFKWWWMIQIRGFRIHNFCIFWKEFRREKLSLRENKLNKSNLIHKVWKKLGMRLNWFINRIWLILIQLSRKPNWSKLKHRWRHRNNCNKTGKKNLKITKKSTQTKLTLKGCLNKDIWMFFKKWTLILLKLGKHQPI